MKINISKQCLKKIQIFLKEKKITLIMISKEIKYNEVYLRKVFSGGAPMSKNLLEAFLRCVRTLLSKNLLEFYELIEKDSDLFQNYKFIFGEKQEGKKLEYPDENKN